MKRTFNRLLFRQTIATLVFLGVWLVMLRPVMAFRSEEDSPPAGLSASIEAKNIKTPAPEQLRAAELLGVRVAWSHQSGMPVSVGICNPVMARQGATPLNLKGCSTAMIKEEANAVLDCLAPVYEIHDAENEFVTRQVIYDQLNYCHVRRPQSYEGLRVVGGELIVHFDKEGKAYEVNGCYVPNIQVPLTIQCQEDEARAIVLTDFGQMGKGHGQIITGPEMVVFAYKHEPRLAYELVVAGEVPARWRYWVDAQNGSILLKFNDLKTISAPSTGSQTTLSGTILSGEGGSSPNLTGWYENTGYYYLYNTNLRWYVYNVAASGYTDNNTYAYRSTGSWGTSDRAEYSAARNFDLVQQYFKNIHGRSSFDNNRAWARANVHQGSQYVNAYWDGSDFHFGDGDGSSANCLAVLDVCAHEFTHGVTEYSADLYYYAESGALNESFSDIFGACVEFDAQPDGRSLYPSAAEGQSDWLCGEDCWLSSTALRDLRSPGNTATVGSGGEQPSRYEGTYWDFGGEVHQNDGVQNFFFYLLSEGGSGNNDGISYNVGGIGISNAAQVAYRTLTVYCGPYTDYAAAPSAWLSAAGDLNQAWVTSVSQAWDAAGVSVVAEWPEITSVSLGQAVNAPELTWKTWNNTGSYWLAETATTHDGSSAAQSGPIGNGKQSRIDTTVTGPGTFSFYWKVSSEENWDYLIFYIDGIQQAAISGNSGWQSKSYTISQGTHTCRWIYSKDTSVASGSDAGWVDEVVWNPSNNHSPATPASASPANGATGVSLTPVLQASAFSDQDGDSHANSQWQVDNNSSFSNPEWDSGESYPADIQVTVPANKLSENTVYYWRVRYKDNQGLWSGWASAFGFTTAQSSSAPSTTPPAPSGVLAGDGADVDKVLVYWTSVSSATSYKVWRGTDNNAQNASVLGTCTTSFYLDTSAAPGSIYYYWIQAVNAVGASELSSPDSGYCGSISPGLTIPTGVMASNGSYNNRILVTWQTVNNAICYEVWRHTENNRAAASLISETTANSYDDYSVSQGIYYYYWIRAKDSIGWGGFSEADNGWCRIASPARVTVSDGSYPYHIRIAWNPVANASGYEIWRAEVPSGSSTPEEAKMIAQTTGNYIDDYETVAGTVYRYSVRAYNGIGSSDYGADTGWRQINSASTESSAVNDLDGDRLSDLAIFSPSTGVLTVLCSTLGRQAFAFGTEINNGLSGDFDGDGQADPVAYCQDSGTWLVMLSSIGYNRIIQVNFGGNGNDPAAADFDGDCLSDLAAYNENNGMLSVILSNGGAYDRSRSLSIGGPGYCSASADYDGDGLADPAVYSESEGRVIVMFSGNEYYPVNVMLGGPGQSMSAADFDGDRRADPVLYEEATGIWTVLLSSVGYGEANILFGGPGYVPAIGDYDGDAKADPAIYREANGQWLIMLSAGDYSVIAETFGGASLKPIGR